MSTLKFFTHVSTNQSAAIPVPESPQSPVSCTFCFCSCSSQWIFKLVAGLTCRLAFFLHLWFKRFTYVPNTCLSLWKRFYSIPCSCSGWTTQITREGWLMKHEFCSSLTCFVPFFFAATYNERWQILPHASSGCYCSVNTSFKIQKHCKAISIITT